MKIKIESSKLGGAVSQVSRIVKAKEATDPFAFMSVVAKEGFVTVTGANGSVSVAIKSPCEVHTEGEVALYAKYFASFAGALPSGIAEFACTNNIKASLEVSGTRFAIAAKENDVKTLEIGEVESSFVVSSAVLKELIRKTSPAMSHDDTRRTLMGILFEGDGHMLKVVATDGRRLHMVETEIEHSSPIRFVLRMDAASVVSNLLGDAEEVTVVSGRNGVEFSTDAWTVRAAIPADPYPVYSRVFPDESKLTTTVTIDREALKGALARAVLATDSDSSCAKLTITEDAVSVSSSSGDERSMVASIPAKVTGGKLVVSFNAKLVNDALGVIEGNEVRILTADKLPMIVKCAVPFYAIVSPIRV